LPSWTPADSPIQGQPDESRPGSDYRLETPWASEAVARIANTQPLVVEKFSKV
jgi:hypothetical protein